MEKISQGTISYLHFCLRNQETNQQVNKSPKSSKIIPTTIEVIRPYKLPGKQHLKNNIYKLY